MEKSLRVGTKTYPLVGLSDDPTYFDAITEDFENPFKQFCETYLQDDFVALDVGANIGVTSIILSHYLSAGHIYSFEPGPNVFERLQQNTERLPNVTVGNTAVSSASGTVAFSEHSAYGHILSGGGIQVSAQTVDQIVDGLCLQRLDFVKVDVEGFEPQVFEGAVDTLAKFDPAIYFEFNTWCLLAHSASDPISFLKSVFDRYPMRYRINPQAPGGLEDFSGLSADDAARRLTHDNVTKFGSVNDILVTSSHSTVAQVASRQLMA